MLEGQTRAVLLVDLDTTNTKIEELRAQLVAKETLVSKTLSLEKLANVLKALAQCFTKTNSLATLTKLAKILDPLLLTNRKDPTFDSQKLQIRGKLQANIDYFLTKEACIIYVFSCTSSNAQEHLSPWYNKELDLFLSSKEIIDYLVSIYKNLYKVQNT